MRLLTRMLPDEVSPEARATLHAALSARARLSAAEAEALIELALAPEYRSAVEEHEIRAFGARFGPGEESALRAAIAEDIDLASFGKRYSPEEALLLLDALFAMCAHDRIIEGSEIGRLQQSAAELGIDPMLVGALFRKHDTRHLDGDFSFNLGAEDCVIGRSPSANVQLPDPQVALQHAKLVRTNEGLRVVDLGSGRPTLLNGHAVAAAPMGPGDSLRIGPYTLQLDRDGSRLTAFGPRSFSALSVRDLKRSIGDVPLLDGVSFTVFSGEVIAMVGPSGAGKTTLLTAIAGIAPADSGDVLLDGQDFHQLLANDRSVVGIVPQDDVVHADLTVEESLFYAGRLRFARDVTAAQIRLEVDRVLDELGIDHVRKSRVGDAVRRGISGGQRKRVSLGQELLTHSTRILFLDEPTSGLDPQTAQDIVALVRQLADDGRIVFLVTHDLSPSVMSMVDHLLVLAPGGRQAWFGPPDEACAWFDVGSPDAIFGRLPDSSPGIWKQRYRDGEPWRKFVRTREHLLGLDGVEATGGQDRDSVRRSLRLQYQTLTVRYAKVKLRDRMGTAVLLAQAPILAVAMWLVFPDPDTSAMFMLALSSLWFGASGSVRELIAERAIWQRERRVGLAVLPYMASKVTVLGALVAAQCLTLTGLVWLMLGMSSYGVSFALLGAVTVLTGLVGSSMGLLMSAIFNSSEAAVGTLPLALIPQIAFGGLIVKLKEMGTLATLVSSTMFTRYAFEACIRSADELSVPSFRGTGRQAYPQGGVLANFGFRSAGSIDDGLTMWVLAAVLVGSAIVMIAVATVLTRRTGDS